MKKLKTGINKLVGRRVLLLPFFVILLISSCATTTALPAYQPLLPEKPELEEMTEVSDEAYRNIIKLMAYSEAQAVVLEEWQKFYNDLRATL